MGESEPRNISKHTNAILKMFDLEPTNVASIRIKPGMIEFDVFKLNENGNKFTVRTRTGPYLPAHDDGESFSSSTAIEPAMETKKFKVRT